MSKKEDEKKKTGKRSFLNLWFSPADEVVSQLADELEKIRADEEERNGVSQSASKNLDNGDARKESAAADDGEQRTDKKNGKPGATSNSSGHVEPEVSPWSRRAVTQSIELDATTGETEDTQTYEGFQRYLQRFDFYELLQIDPGASNEQIHKSYLRRVRHLIGSHETDSNLESWQVESLVQAISLAHEVLRDSSTKSSYDKNRDFRKLVAEDATYEPVRKRAQSGKNIHSLISLIRYSQLLTAADLDAAMAINQGKTELQIASYLVDVGKLTVEELESITLARYLIALGKITITQYEIIIGEMKDTGTPLWVGLVAKGWVKMTDVLSN